MEKTMENLATLSDRELDYRLWKELIHRGMEMDILHVYRDDGRLDRRMTPSKSFDDFVALMSEIRKAAFGVPETPLGKFCLRLNGAINQIAETSPRRLSESLLSEMLIYS